MRPVLQRRREAGDTIVEVLIAIAVISSVLAITYSIMNRNLRTMRDNQERTEAAKLAQGQLELLRAWWASESGKDELQRLSGAFCLDSNLEIGETPPLLGSGAPTSNPEDDDYADYPAACVSGFYHTGIRRQSGNTYQVTVRWDSLGGSRSQIIYAYILE